MDKRHKQLQDEPSSDVNENESEDQGSVGRKGGQSESGNQSYGQTEGNVGETDLGDDYSDDTI